MSQLPKVWVEVRAEDICDKVQSGSTPSNSPFTESGDIPYLKVYNIVNQKIAFDYRKQFVSMEIHEEKLARSKVFPNDVLMNIVGPPLGKVAIVTSDYPEWNINQAITLFRTNNAFLLNKFLFYFLHEGSSVKSIHGELKGSVGQVNISLSQCRDFLVPLPPLAEQNRIVEKLDEVLAQVDTIKTRLDGIPAILKRFRQSLLAAAVSGRLTKEWRGSNSINEPLRKKLGDVITKIGQGWSPKCENTPAENHAWGVIKTSSVQNISFWEHENKALPTSLEPRPEHELFAGDILITRAGPRVRCGVTAFVESTRAKLMICDKVYRFRVKEAEGHSKYLVYLLNAPQYLAEIEKMKTGISDSGMNLTQSKFKQFSLLWPHKEEQAEIICLIDQYFAFADTIEAQVKKAQTRVDSLTQAILAKAFRGELTADWRAANPDLISGDNSAEALLARIQAERAQSAKKGRKSTQPAP